MTPGEAEDDPETPTPTEEELAAERDRVGGRQFGRVMMVLGAAGAAAGLFVLDAQYAVFGGLAFFALGALAHRYPVQIVRLFSGMSDKM